MNRKPKEPSMGMRSDQALASNGIDPDVRREILRRLAVIESEEEVRIAYACEYLYEGQVRLKKYFYVLRSVAGYTLHRDWAGHSAGSLRRTRGRCGTCGNPASDIDQLLPWAFTPVSS